MARMLILSLTDFEMYSDNDLSRQTNSSEMLQIFLRKESLISKNNC